MTLIISGIALSFQRIPSRTYFEENLVVHRDDLPVMVEHPGEVILEAVKNIRPSMSVGLTLIPMSDPPEYGFYLDQLKERFTGLEIADPKSSRLIDLIHQAASILKNDPNHLVVISETTKTGSAAIAISGSNPDIEGKVKIHLPDLPSDRLVDFELAGYTGDLDRAGIDTLAALISERSGGRSVSFADSSSFYQSGESLLNLIMPTLSITEKTLPYCTPPDHIQSMIEQVSNLHFSTHSRPWFAKRDKFQRSAVLIGQRDGSSIWHPLFLEEIPLSADRIGVRQIDAVDPYLFLISSDDQAGLIEGLEGLENELRGRESLKTLANNAYTQFTSGAGKYTCTLLAASREGLQNEIAHAKTGLVEAFQSKKNWSSPAGSYFTPSPLGNHEIAFVYPGAFNSYPGMAKNLFFAFPGLQDAALEIIPDLSSSLAENLFFPLKETPSPEYQASGDEFNTYHAKLIESGISLSVIYTMILEKVFNLNPAAAFGYSLGETSMLWATRVWYNAQEESESWNRSPLFKDELAGKMNIVREYWQNQDLPDDFWGTYILKASLERVKEACAAEDLVSLTIQNSEDEIVIAGEKDACSRVIKALSCHALPLPINTAIHHPAMQSSFKSFQELYSIPTSSRSDIRFYTAANYGELVLTQADLASSIAQMTCNPVDFPRLVNQVYDDGARIFIEVGPQKTCSRWIEKILKGKPHAVVPINKRFQADLQGIFKVLALLLSHGVTLELDALFSANNQKPPAATTKSSSVDSQQIKTQQRPTEEVTIPIPTVNTLTLTENLDRISADLAKTHSEFLAQQSHLTKVLTRIMKLKTGESTGEQPISGQDSKALFNHDQIQAFTVGDHQKCFGDQFNGFGKRRFPRLPNGPLQLIDRVHWIEGKSGDPQSGAALISEVDLPLDAWYWKKFPQVLPHVALMEIALQPCGFLSAYLGTILGREDQDLYFRNLDGEAALLYWPEKIGPVITNKVELVSSSSLENVIIQKFNFSLSQGGSTFFQGSSSFGYFPQAMLVDQDGLDGKKPTKSWFDENHRYGNWQEVHQNGKMKEERLAVQLPEINHLWVSPKGGSHNRGYIYFEEEIPEKAWFYKAHFYQDPVMPGSLGVETMARALMAAAPNWDIPDHLTWRIKPGSRLSWKYRGQITPETPNLVLDLHLQSIAQTSSGWEVCADGQLWKDSRRIYQVDNLCLESIPEP